MVDDFGSDVDAVENGLAVSSLLISNSFSVFLGQSIKCFSLLFVHHFFFRNWNVQASNLHSELVSSSCTVLTFSISGLNEEHSFSVNVIVFKKSRTIDDGLICFGVEEICELSRSDSKVIFTTRDSDLALFRLIKRWGFAFDEVFVLENTNSINRGLSSEKSDSDLPVALLEASTIDGEFGLAC